MAGDFRLRFVRMRSSLSFSRCVHLGSCARASARREQTDTCADYTCDFFIATANEMIYRWLRRANTRANIYTPLRRAFLCTHTNILSGGQKCWCLQSLLARASVLFGDYGPLMRELAIHMRCDGAANRLGRIQLVDELWIWSDRGGSVVILE